MLKPDQDFHSEVIHSLQQSIAVLDMDGYIVNVNPAWKKSSIEDGIPAHFDWIGVNYLQICDALGTDEDQWIEDLEALLNGKSTYFSAEFHSTFRGKTRWFVLEASPLLQKGTNIIKGIVICMTNITRIKQMEIQLIDALSQIRTLHGLLPICAVCKSIRDDQDVWNSIELFLEKHTHAEFTHDICPDCIRRLYPEYSAALDSPS